VALARAGAGADNNIHLSGALVEMLGTNDAALAFVIAHMSAHGVMHFIGVPDSGPFTNDPEGLADAVAAGTLLRGGFDPSGAADFFARLVYADKQGPTVDNPLRVEFGLPNGLQTRLQKLWTFIDDGCDMGKPLYDICQAARKYWHPHTRPMCRKGGPPTALSPLTEDKRVCWSDNRVGHSSGAQW